ncbi:MAG TPA: hypothetical protein VI795_00475 [Patescibacteria group bacterium]|nr:hypothetical protein [Patescibacteria group bacterium]
MSEKIVSTGIVIPENCRKNVGFSVDYNENGNIITLEGEGGQLTEDNPQCNLNGIKGLTMLQAKGKKLTCRELAECPFCRI